MYIKMLADNELVLIPVPRDAHCPFSTISVILSRSNLSTVKHTTSEVRDYVSKKASEEVLTQHYNAHPEQNWAKQIDKGHNIEKSMRKVIAKYTNPLYHGMESTLNLISSAYNIRIYLLSADELDIKLFGSEDAQFFGIMKTNEDGYIDAVLPLPESGVDSLLSKTTVPSGLFKMMYPRTNQTVKMEIESDYPILAPASKLCNHDRWIEYIMKSIMTIDDRGKKYAASNTIQQSYTFETNRRDLQVVVTVKSDEPPSRVYHFYSSHSDPVFEETFTKEVAFSTPDEVVTHLSEELRDDIVLEANVFVKDKDILLIDPRSVLHIDS